MNLELFIPTKKHQVSMTGIFDSGKTSFLTSLLWNLEEFGNSTIAKDDITHFKLFEHENKKENNLYVKLKNKLKIKNKKLENFDYESIKNILQNDKKWPNKTQATSTIKCELNFDKIRKHSIDFTDFPGERIADVSIAMYKKYEDWSDYMLKLWKSKSEYNKYMQTYLTVCQYPCVRLDKLIYTYKKAMFSLIANYKPLITPSTFLLSQTGELTEGSKKYIEGFDIHNVFSGLKEKEFCPLPLEHRKRFPELKKYYSNYRKEIALPLYDKVFNSECLLIFVDIADILKGGVERYNDVVEIINSFLNTIAKSLNKMNPLSKIFLNKIKRIAFVASKADLVHPSDIDNLKELLKRMTYNISRKVKSDLDIDYFTCSAIKSTKKSEDGKLIIAYLNNSNVLEKYEVSPVPNQWPEDWRPGEFRYFDVAPEISRNFSVPPKNENLDKILEFILEG